MKDIRFLGSDGDFLLLEDSEGQKFRLLIDESIRRSIRNDQNQRLDQPTLTPREIQEEIRVGRSIDDIVRASGAAVEYVMKFAQPVLDELNHAVLNALTVRLEVPGDRFNEPTTREFGEIIKARLAASGAGIERWSALKAPDHGFYLYCEFELGGDKKKATWTYDPKRLALVPEDALAISLSTSERMSTAAPKLKTVQSPEPFSTPNLPDTVDLARTLPQPVVARSEPVATSSQPISETADLLDALRKKRSERELVETAEHVPQTDFLSLVPDVQEQELVTEEDEEDITPTPSVVQSESTATPKRGRASIPSWDEIVFGTKTED
jgi:hypothetical protein